MAQACRGTASLGGRADSEGHVLNLCFVQGVEDIHDAFVAGELLGLDGDEDGLLLLGLERLLMLKLRLDTVAQTLSFDALGA